MQAALQPLRRSALCLLALLASCANAQRAGVDAVRAGRIWDARAGTYIGASDVRRAVVSAPVVLLGETHDNLEHHRLQRELLGAIVASGRRPVLVMEQFDRQFQPELEAEQAKPGRTAETVLDAGHFDRRGWDVDGYRPLVALALEFDLPIVAGNLSRDDARAIVRDPARAALPPVDKRVEESLAADIDRSHCGEKAPPALLTGMVAAQRARDVTMARALESNRARGAVLIAGVGHVRADRGAPLYMTHRPLVIAFIEVDPDLSMPSEYLDGEFATMQSFDYMWFTPRAERADPCAAKPALPRAAR